MAKITILGAGVTGSAFSVPLTDNGHQIDLVGTHLDESIIEQLRRDNVHPSLGIKLSNHVRFFTYDQLDQAVAQTDLLVIAVNALGIEWVGMMLTMILDDALSPDVPILFLTKGLEGKNDGNHWVSKNERIRILPDTLRDGLMPHHAEQLHLLVTGGSSSASDVANRQPALLIVAGPNAAQIDQIAGYLRTPTYAVSTSTDLVGVALCAALQDLYALAVALHSGLPDQHDSASTLSAQSLREMSYLVSYMGGQQETIAALTNADALQIESQRTQNFRMGQLLGSGLLYTDAKQQPMPSAATDDVEMALATVDGAELAMAIGRTIEFLCREGALDPQRLPLLRMMTNVICNDGVVDVPWDEFVG